MIVVIAAYAFLPTVGGVSTTVAILARTFVKEGHDVTVVTLTKGPVDGYDYKVVRNPGPTELYRLYARADVLILANLALRIIYPLLFIRRRFALQHHSESAYDLGYGPADILRRIIRARATHFMTSHYIGKRSGFAKYVVTHPFPDTEQVDGEIASSVQGRDHALFVGRVEPEKGILWLCERWAQVRIRLGVDTLRVVGPGSAEATVASKLRDGEWSGIELVGALDRAKTAAEMAKAAYLFVPSLWHEPFGAVALEGIAAGAITISSNRGGLTEAGAALAFYYDPDDEPGFYRAVSEARDLFRSQLADSNERAEYCRRVQRHIERFDPSNVVQKILNEMVDVGRVAQGKED